MTSSIARFCAKLCGKTDAAQPRPPAQPGKLGRFIASVEEAARKLRRRSSLLDDQSVPHHNPRDSTVTLMTPVTVHVEAADANRATNVEQPKLDEILSDRESEVFRAFRAHVREEQSENNLDFVLLCDDYHAGLTVNGLSGPELLKHIFDTYMAPGAAKETNFEAIRKRLIESQGNLQAVANLLRAARSEIFRLMNKDAFPRFLKTEQTVRVHLPPTEIKEGSP